VRRAGSGREKGEVSRLSLIPLVSRPRFLAIVPTAFSGKLEQAIREVEDEVILPVRKRLRFFLGDSVVRGSIHGFSFTNPRRKRT